jgi:peptidyl-prolyl cis-trans isomerase SurA
MLIAATLINPALAETVILDRVLVLVDDNVVTESDLQDRLEQITASYRNSNKPQPPREVLREQVLDRLILESIQLQMGQRAGIRISDEALNDTISRIASRNGQTLEQFRAAIASEGRSYVSVREQIRREMITNQVQQGNLRSRIQITEQEVENFLSSSEGEALKSSQYHIAHLVLPKAKSAKDKTFMSSLTKALNAKQLDFAQLLQDKQAKGRAIDGGDLGWRKQDELPSIFAPVVSKLKVGRVSEPVVSGAGIHIVKLLEQQGGGNQLIEQSHVRHILIKTTAVRDANQAKALIQDIAARLKQGEDFASLAREFSDDPGSALQGGDLDWTSKGQMVGEFEATMLATQPGEISKPFTSQFGWHILEVLERREHDASAERWKQQAYNAIYQRKYNDELDAWLQKIRDESFVEFKQFDNVSIEPDTNEDNYRTDNDV